MFTNCIVISMVVVLWNNNYCYDFLGFMIFNLGIYLKIAENWKPIKNYRSLMSYLIVSSLSFIIVTFAMITSIIIPWLSYVLFAMVTSLKLVLYPFTYFYISFYENIRFKLYYVLTIVSKILFVIFYQYLVGLYYSYYIVLANLIIVPILATYSNNLISLLVYSSALQIGYAFLPLLKDNIENVIFYVIYYLIGFTILYMLTTSKLKNRLEKFWLSFVCFSYVGLPPFTGFYIKMIILNNFANHLTINLLLLIIVFNVISTYIYFNIFIRYQSNKIVGKVSYINRNLYMIGSLYCYISLLPFDCLII